MRHIFLLLFVAACASYREAPHVDCDGRIDFKENYVNECVSIGDPRYLPSDSERQQGSGLGLTPHMRLGPGGNSTTLLPDVPPPFSPPPLNNGQNGVPNDIPIDDPGTGSGDWNCIVTFINQTSTEKAKYNTVCSMLKTVVPSLAFKNKVLEHKSYNNSVGYYGTSSTCNGAGELGNVGPAVYAHIINGDERKPSATAIDSTMNMKVEMYRDDASSTIGYTYGTSDQIWVNRKYSDGYKPASLGSNLFHEWLHKLGYGHSSSPTSCRPYSIPYAIGYIARDFMTPLQGAYGY